MKLRAFLKLLIATRWCLSMFSVVLVVQFEGYMEAGEEEKREKSVQAKMESRVVLVVEAARTWFTRE